MVPFPADLLALRWRTVRFSYAGQAEFRHFSHSTKEWVSRKSVHCHFCSTEITPFPLHRGQMLSRAARTAARINSERLDTPFIAAERGGDFEGDDRLFSFLHRNIITSYYPFVKRTMGNQEEMIFENHPHPGNPLPWRDWSCSHRFKIRALANTWLNSKKHLTLVLRNYKMCYK